MDRDTVDTACRSVPRQRPKSEFQFESDRVFDQQNSELVSQIAGYKPSNVQEWLRVRVQSQLADRTQVEETLADPRRNLKKLRSPRGSVLMCVFFSVLSQSS